MWGGRSSMIKFLKISSQKLKVLLPTQNRPMKKSWAISNYRCIFFLTQLFHIWKLILHMHLYFAWNCMMYRVAHRNSWCLLVGDRFEKMMVLSTWQSNMPLYKRMRRKLSIYWRWKTSKNVLLSEKSKVYHAWYAWFGVRKEKNMYFLFKKWRKICKKLKKVVVFVEGSGTRIDVVRQISFCFITIWV